MSCKPVLVGLIAALAASGAAVAASPPAGTAVGSASRGLAVAERTCSQCHAIGTMGMSPNPASPPFRDLHKRYPADSLEDAFAKGLLTHHPAMPKIQLSTRERADLVAYFKTLRAKGETEASIGSIGPLAAR